MYACCRGVTSDSEEGLKLRSNLIRVISDKEKEKQSFTQCQHLCRKPET